MPYRNGNMPPNATIWTKEMEDFLRLNYTSMTNAQLAVTLQLRKTVTRNKLRELGLKRMELEYWCEAQVRYLKDNYKTAGDVEIMEYFKKNYPKQKGWKRSAISKKRKQLSLTRTEEEIAAIISKNCSPGGRQYTIDKNSSSFLMSDGWVAVTMARTNPELREELLKNPELIEAKRSLLKLKRAIKEKEKHAA